MSDRKHGFSFTMAKTHKQSKSKSARGHASWHTVVYQIMGSLVGMVALLYVAPFVPGLKSLVATYATWAQSHLAVQLSVKRKGIKTASAAAHDIDATGNDSDASSVHSGMSDAGAPPQHGLPPDDVKKLATMVPTVVYIATSPGCHHCVQWEDKGHKQNLIDRCCKEPNVAVVVAGAPEYYLAVEFLPWISVVLSDGSCVPLDANREDAEACLNEAKTRTKTSIDKATSSDDPADMSAAPVRMQSPQLIGRNANSPASGRLAPLHS